MIVFTLCGSHGRFRCVDGFAKLSRDLVPFKDMIHENDVIFGLPVSTLYRKDATKLLVVILRLH